MTALVSISPSYPTVPPMFCLSLKVGASTGYTVFVWLFGIFAGGYHYALKMFVFEKVRNVEFKV